MIIDTHLHYTPKDEHGHGDTVEEVLAAARAAGIDKIVQSRPRRPATTTATASKAHKTSERRHRRFGRIDPTTPGPRAAAHQPHGPTRHDRRTHPSPQENPIRSLAQRTHARSAPNLCQERNIPVGFYPPDQPKELRETAHRFPGLRVIAEQMTLYAVKGVTDVYHQWEEVLKLAQEPNVWTKISLFPQAAPKDEKYPFPTSQARFKQLYELVGPARLIGLKLPLGNRSLHLQTSARVPHRSRPLRPQRRAPSDRRPKLRRPHEYKPKA